MATRGEVDEAVRVRSSGATGVAEGSRFAAAGATAAELETLYRTAPVGLSVVDRHHRIVRINDYLARLHGRPVEEHLGRSVYELFPAGAETVRPLIERVLESGEPLLGVEMRAPLEEGGTPRDWVVSYHPLHDAAGDVEAISCVVREVTRERRMEEQLTGRIHELEILHALSADVMRAGDLDELYGRALDAVLEAVAEADRAALLLFDDEGVMRFRAWRGLSDAYRAAVEGHSPWDRDTTDAEPIVVADAADHPDVAGELREAILAEGIRSLAFVPVAAGDRLLGKFMLYAAVPDAFGGEQRLATTVANHVGIAIERRRREEALRAADRRKDEFLAVLAHELRNPLAALANGVEALRRRQIEGDRRRALDAMMASQISQLVRLVDDLLDVSRISRGKVALRRERVATAAAVGRAVEVVRPEIDERRQRLAVTIAPECTTLVADPARLEQILVNLLANASKYGRRGGRIEVGVRAEGGEVRVAVTDDGVGLLPDERDAVFEPFRQIRDDAAGSGLGIGLSLVRQLVELHGGRVTAESAGPGRGSTFTAALPVAASPDPVPVPPVPPPRRAESRSVLVVDDNRAAAEALGLLLEGEGWNVRVAFGGEEALAAARREPPEVVLLDLEMPGIDGFEVAKALRADAVLGDALLVAVTGFGHEEARRKVREAGFDHHLVKPVDVDALLTLVADYS